jgi:hypothetical protein
MAFRISISPAPPLARLGSRDAFLYAFDLLEMDGEGVLTSGTCGGRRCGRWSSARIRASSCRIILGEAALARAAVTNESRAQHYAMAAYYTRLAEAKEKIAVPLWSEGC